MSIKSKRITKRIFATFLILSLTLCYFTISASAATQRYVHVNDTYYKSANAFGWEELPYGTDTGVVQFQYTNNNYLTLYFDKLTIYDDTSEYDNEARYLNDWYWNAIYDDSSGKLDYLVNIVSDSPIYYKTTYYSDSVFSSSIGDLTDIDVAYPDITDGSTNLNSVLYRVYKLTDFRLSSLVPSNWELSSVSTGRRVYSNCYQLHANVFYYYYPYQAAGPTDWVNGKNVGYNVEYYPTVEYLQNYDIRKEIIATWTEIVDLQKINNNILSELYTANDYLFNMVVYLSNIDNMTTSIQSLLDIYLPLLNYNLGEILEVLEDILSGPEYDSSQGIGSNSSFGDAAGGLMQNTNVPSMDIGGIQSSLGSSFLFIRSMFDWFGRNYQLSYVISFLLGLSFIAYVLGRVIKNKMNNG